MARNPFEVFGLTPEMVAGLSEKDLFAVIKSLYRALQKTVHPDVVKKSPRKDTADKAVELNLAFESLNLDKNPVAFRRHRKTFIARRPKVVYQKSLALQREIMIRQAREDFLASAYLDRLLTDYGWLEDRPAPPPPGLALFPLTDLRLGLLDVAINQNLKMAPWSIGSNYKEINFDDKGRMTVRPVGRTRFTRAGYIHLIGSVSVDAVDLMPLLERPPARFFKAPALNASIGANGPSLSVLNRIKPELFRSHVLPHLKPQVAERSYLFSLNRPELTETGCLTLEGLIVKLDFKG